MPSIFDFTLDDKIESLLKIKKLRTCEHKINQIIEFMIAEEQEQLNHVRETSPTYNHALSVAFSISGSTDPEGKDITRSQLIAALQERIAELMLASDDEVFEAIMPPYDSYEEE